jgi:hypothetical protein
MPEVFEPFREPGGLLLDLIGPFLSGATIAPTAKIHHINNTTAISTITPPYTDFAGGVFLVADSQFTITTSGNVALAVTTTVANKAYHLIYDKKTAKWYPTAQS